MLIDLNILMLKFQFPPGLPGARPGAAAATSKLKDAKFISHPLA
jgi:hypothetical protein